MIVAMSRDIRVLVIKLADRLHNMRTLRYVRQETQERGRPRDARHLRAAGPPARHEHHQVGARGPRVRDPAPQDLRRDRADGRRAGALARPVPGRGDRPRSRRTCARPRSRRPSPAGPKHYYSIYQKMIVGGREFTDIYDLVGIRILVDGRPRLLLRRSACCTRAGTRCSGRFKDYVAMPKFNMYQSLHTTVIGPQGKPVEMQIRTFAMHRRAEYGVAAHWKYKEDGRAGVDTDKLGDLDDMTWVRQLLDWQSEVEDPGEFLESLRFEINRAEIYVFTPRGDVIALPAGATPVDFAYAVHTEVGHHTIGARVNGRLVPLESTLENGDVVEVFTSKAPNAGPSRDWLDLRQVAAGPHQDPAVVHQGAPRGGDRARQGADRQADAQGGAAAQAAAVPRVADRWPPRTSRSPTSPRSTPRSARATCQRPGRRTPGHRAARRRRTAPRRTSPRRVTITGRRGRSKSPSGGDAGVDRQGRARRLGQARQVLHPGAARRRSSASSPRAAASRCTAPTAPTPTELRSPARAAARGRVGADRPVDVPGQHPGRGARPRPAALRHHDGALRRAREHPQRQPAPPPATGSPRAASPSRWPRPSTSTPSSRPSARSPASSTPTASPSEVADVTDAPGRAASDTALQAGHLVTSQPDGL